MLTTIGITFTKSHYSNYPLWIKDNDISINIIQLNESNTDDLKMCDGIVLTGGIDTHPKFYNNTRIDYPNAPMEFDIARDEFELHIFKHCQEKNIAVLAICRGMQLVNIALGGNLIQDIEEIGKFDHRGKEEVDGMHSIIIRRDSLLHEITGITSGTINSAHHQSIGNIGNNLTVTSFSPDGIAEALEWKNKEGKPFFLGVQWHPERTVNQQKLNPCSDNIRKSFLKATKKY